MPALHQLAIHDVDGGEHALFPHGHRLVVYGTAAHSPYIKVTLAHVVALHQIRLDRGDVIQLLELDAVVDGRCGQQRIALRMRHLQVGRCLECAAKATLQQLRFLVAHRLQVNVCFLFHHEGAHLALLHHASVPV